MLFKMLQQHYVKTGWYGCIYRFLPSKTADMSLANQNENIDSGKWSINHAKWWHYGGILWDLSIKQIWQHLWWHFIGHVNHI